jgi:hypothetical protein
LTQVASFYFFLPFQLKNRSGSRGTTKYYSTTLGRNDNARHDADDAGDDADDAIADAVTGTTQTTIAALHVRFGSLADIDKPNERRFWRGKIDRNPENPWL